MSDTIADLEQMVTFAKIDVIACEGDLSAARDNLAEAQQALRNAGRTMDHHNEVAEGQCVTSTPGYL